MSEASVERVRYEAYGRPFLEPVGDIDGDGTTSTITDGDFFLYHENSGGSSYASTSDDYYAVEADTVRDGDVDLATDSASLDSGLSGGRDALSKSGSIVGLAGYRFEEVTGLYCVRNRWLSASDGRWIVRDPGLHDSDDGALQVTHRPHKQPELRFQLYDAPHHSDTAERGLLIIPSHYTRYADGHNLYEYVGSAALTKTDPLGLCEDTLSFTGHAFFDSPYPASKTNQTKRFTGPPKAMSCGINGVDLSRNHIRSQCKTLCCEATLDLYACSIGTNEAYMRSLASGCDRIKTVCGYTRALQYVHVRGKTITFPIPWHWNCIDVN